MTTFVAIITAMCIVVLVLWLARQFNKNKKYYKNIPGPLPLPILGNALEFGSTTSKCVSICHDTQGKTFLF